MRAAYNPEGPDILNGINLRIAPGTKVGICGRSGSEKSSLLLSLFCMLENVPGDSMFIDDINITTLPRSILQERLTAIPQETLIIPGSVQENMDCRRPSAVVNLNCVTNRVAQRPRYKLSYDAEQYKTIHRDRGTWLHPSLPVCGAHVSCVFQCQL